MRTLAGCLRRIGKKGNTAQPVRKEKNGLLSWENVATRKKYKDGFL